MMLDDLDNVFDDHPSLDASLEDFENNSNARRSPTFGLPSQHSGFRSESDGEEDDTIHGGRWSPPGCRGHDFVPGSGWYRHQPYERKPDPDKLLSLQPTVGIRQSQSREPSPQYEDAHEMPAAGRTDDVDAGDTTVAAGDTTVAANVPLPTETGSPVKHRSPSPAPAAQTSPEPEGLDFGADNLSNCRLTLVWPVF